MKKTLSLLLVAAGLLPAQYGIAEGFGFTGTAPSFTVSIPSIPQIDMGIHPMHDQKPYLRYFGSKGPYAISVVTPKADAGMGASDCAQAISTTIGARPGVPEQKHIYKAKINSKTYALIYVTAVESNVYMHTHLISSAPEEHCVEVHLSKQVEAREEIEPWFKRFGDANIKSD